MQDSIEKSVTENVYCQFSKDKLDSKYSDSNEFREIKRIYDCITALGEKIRCIVKYSLLVSKTV